MLKRVRKFVLFFAIFLMVFSVTSCSNSESLTERPKIEIEQLTVEITDQTGNINSQNLKLLVEDYQGSRKVEEFNESNQQLSVNLTNLEGEIRIVPVYENENYTFEPPIQIIDDYKNKVEFKFQEKNMEIEKRVMAFYYPWYRTEDYSGQYFHWEKIDKDNQEISNSTNYPVGGPYDSTNPKVIERHLEQLSQAGVDTIIVSWWGQQSPSDQALDLILDKAEEYGINVSLYYEENEELGSEARIDKSISDLKYIFKNYAQHPAYLWSRNEPVLFLYGRIMDQLSDQEWSAVIERFNSEIGIDFAMIADDLSVESAEKFAGIHRYNYANHMQELLKDKSIAEVESIKENEFSGWTKLVENNDAILAAPIIPGYDDRKIRNPGIHVPRLEGEVYRALWNAAISADPDWILITSFNEWHEGTEIEPSLENGEKYLEITNEKAAEW